MNDELPAEMKLPPMYKPRLAPPHAAESTAAEREPSSLMFRRALIDSRGLTSELFKLIEEFRAPTAEFDAGSCEGMGDRDRVQTYEYIPVSMEHVDFG